MAFSFSNVTGLDHGILLDIVFTKGVRDNISQDFAEFDLVQSIRNKEATPRALTYKVLTHRGPARVQYMNPGSATESMPRGQKVGISEHTAYFKELASVVEVDSNLIQRLKATPAKAADELALEMDASVFDLRRRICADFYADGTGLLVRAKSVAATTGVAGTAKVVVTAANMGETVDSLAAGGSITFLEEGELLLGATKAGAAADPTVTGTFYAWMVSDVDVDAGTFTIKPVSSAYANLAMSAEGIAAGTCFYRLAQSGGFPDLTSSIADYGTASKSFVGLESLGANDGRVVNGLTMSALFAGTRITNTGLIDIDMMQAAFSKAKRRAGAGAVGYNKAIVHDKAWDVLVLSKEGDRRFQSVEDNARGSKKFVFVHGPDTIEMIVSPFCPINRLWALPSSSKNGKVVEMHMTDHVSQKSPDGGSPWHRLTGSTAGSYTKQFAAFSSSHLQMVASQPSAIVSIAGFALS